MRTFVAVEVTNQVAIKSMLDFQKMLLNSGFRAKPVGANQLHFTLIFLGEINETMLDSIRDRLVDLKFDPIKVTYTGVGAFPSLKSARVIWVGVDQDSAPRLINLAKEVESRLNILGFRSDKQFRPHITLFRIKERIKNVASIMESKDKVFGTDLLNKIKLKKSVLTPGGPVYTDLFVVGSD